MSMEDIPVLTISAEAYMHRGLKGPLDYDFMGLEATGSSIDCLRGAIPEDVSVDAIVDVKFATFQLSADQIAHNHKYIGTALVRNPIK